MTKTKLLAVFLSVCILLSMVSFNVSAVTIETSPIDTRLMAIFNDKIAAINNSSHNIQISSVKQIQDFSGEIYYAVECVPSGYMIYHPASAVVVESSPSAPSPYSHVSGSNLYYGGPTEYYIKVGDIYEHTVINEKITLSIDVERMRYTSNEITATLNQMKDVALLDYLTTGNKTAYTTSMRASSGNRGGNLSEDEVEWFENLTQCGYFEGPDGDDTYGCCGFIGLNILYAFFDKFVDTKYMPDTHWTSDAKTLLKNWDDSFTKVLHDLDPKDGTTSVHIHDVSKKYLKNNSITDIDHTSRYWGFFNANTIKGILDNGYPVELFGSLADPPGYNGSGKKGGHAVVAYQYTTSSGTQYVCHYGWDNYTAVTIVGTLGSIYAMEVE